MIEAMTHTPPTDPAAALREATIRYKREKDRAAEIERKASEEFAAAIRKAYDGGKGMKKSRIIVAINNEWSRTWIDRACKEVDAKPTPTS